MLETTLGAHLSELLNEEVVAKESGVSRRRVVAGVAWSLPVIATAIAAPAAAASVVPASATLGAVSPISLAGAMSASGPTDFVVQTGTAFTGTSVSYTITIDSVKEEQKALVEIGSASLGTGSSSPVGKSDKLTTFTGTLTTIAGSHTLPVALAGFKYSGAPKAGTYTYTVTLIVTLSGTTLTPATSTLTVTY